MAKKKAKVSDNPIERLYDAGFSLFTLGRIANVPVSHIKVWRKELPKDRPGVDKIRGLLSLYEDMLAKDLDFDPVALYEEQLVLVKINGEKRFVRLYQFFETGIWDKAEFMEYVTSLKSFFSLTEFREMFPDDYQTVEFEGGEKAIVNTNAVESIGNAELIRHKDDISML